MNSINFRRIKGMERNFRRIFTFFQPVVPIVNGDRSSSPIIFKQVKPHNYNPGLKFVSLDLKVIFSARSRIKDCRFHRSAPRELSLISPPPRFTRRNLATDQFRWIFRWIGGWNRLGTVSKRTILKSTWRRRFRFARQNCPPPPISD